MTGTLNVIIKRPLSLEEWLRLAASKLKNLLHVNMDFTIGVQIPRGAPLANVPPIVPCRPGWGLYFYVDGVDESLVEAHLSTLSTESGVEPVSLQIHELRTPASKALAASLAAAAAELLDADIIDHEQVWTAGEHTSPHDFQQQLTVPDEHVTLESALNQFMRGMNRAK